MTILVSIYKFSNFKATPVDELTLDITTEAPDPILPERLYFGPISSIFDITTFWLLWHAFGANSPAHQSLFHSGWFIEGLLSQTLIVHMIRTRRIPFLQSMASAPVLALTAAIITLVLAQTHCNHVLLGILFESGDLIFTRHQQPNRAGNIGDANTKVGRQGTVNVHLQLRIVQAEVHAQVDN